MEDERYQKAGENLEADVKKFIDDLERRRAPDISADNLLDQMHLQAKQAYEDCEAMRFSIDRRIRAAGSPYPKDDDPTGPLFNKGEEYLAISTCIHFAKKRLDEGKDDEALQLAALAGRCYPSASTGDKEALQKIVKNLREGREKGVESRQATAAKNMHVAKQIVDDLFRVRDGKPGEGWRMTKQKIYTYIRKHGVGWSAKYAERKLGSYIEEVKAKNRAE